MTMTPGLRKFALTGHVTSSVGWLGAVRGTRDIEAALELCTVIDALIEGLELGG